MKKQLEPSAGEKWLTSRGIAVTLVNGDSKNTDAKFESVEKRSYAKNYEPLQGGWNANGSCNLGWDQKVFGHLVKKVRNASPVKSTEKPVKESNYQRLALRMSKAKSITEVRAIYGKVVSGGR